jgi:integrase
MAEAIDMRGRVEGHAGRKVVAAHDRIAAVDNKRLLVRHPGAGIYRRKGSDDSLKPLSGVRSGNCAKSAAKQPAGLRHAFVSERGAPFTTNGFFKMLSRGAVSIGVGDVHPHLRHACGYKLVNDGVDTRTLAAYLGHRQLTNTARDAKMDAKRFDAGLSEPSL